MASVTGRRITAELARKALASALEAAGNPEGIILHSDQGSQFTSKLFTEFCESKGVIQSMSRAGCPYDNSPMERYFNTLKAEEVNLHCYRTEELDNSITTYALAGITTFGHIVITGISHHAKLCKTHVRWYNFY